MYTNANTIFADKDENESALELCRKIVSGTLHQGTHEILVMTNAKTDDDYIRDGNEEKTPHNIAMRLKDNKNKFSGDLLQFWQDFKDDYDQISGDYNLNLDQYFCYLHCLLCKDTHRFYLDFVKPTAKTYD